MYILGGIRYLNIFCLPSNYLLAVAQVVIILVLNPLGDINIEKIWIIVQKAKTTSLDDDCHWLSSMVITVTAQPVMFMEYVTHYLVFMYI